MSEGFRIGYFSFLSFFLNDLKRYFGRWRLVVFFIKCLVLGVCGYIRIFLDIEFVFRFDVRMGVVYGFI